MTPKVDNYALRETEEEIRDDCMRSKKICFFQSFFTLIYKNYYFSASLIPFMDHSLIIAKGLA